MTTRGSMSQWRPKHRWEVRTGKATYFSLMCDAWGGKISEPKTSILKYSSRRMMRTPEPWIQGDELELIRGIQYYTKPPKDITALRCHYFSPIWGCYRMLSAFSGDEMIHEAPRLRARTGRLKEQRGPPRPNFFFDVWVEILECWNDPGEHEGHEISCQEHAQDCYSYTTKIEKTVLIFDLEPCVWESATHLSSRLWCPLHHTSALTWNTWSFSPQGRCPPPCRSKRFSASVRSGFGVKMVWVGSVGSPTCGSSTFVPGRTMNYLFIRCWLLTSVSIVDEFTHFFP